MSQLPDLKQNHILNVNQINSLSIGLDKLTSNMKQFAENQKQMNLVEDLNAEKLSNDPSVSLSSKNLVPPVKQKSNDDSLT